MGVKAFVLRSFLLWTVCAGLLTAGGLAQEPASQQGAASGTSIVGCLAGPSADDHYTLTSMQHRMGVDVVGSEELKKGVGTKVKLTGSWEALPGAEGKKDDASRRFRATAVTVLEEKCQAPEPVTPVSKKKAQKTK